MFRLALPALAEEALVLMVAWTDWFLTSRYLVDDGDATKAAMGLMAYLMWLVPSSFSVVSIGATALIARWTGAHDYEAAKKVVNQAYMVGAIFAVILTATMWVWGESFIGWMRLKDDAADYALSYLNIITVVIPLIMCSQIGAACLRGAGDTVSGFLVKLIVVLINIGVSTFLVTGWGFYETSDPWRGLAYGTAAGYAVGGAILTTILVFGRAGLELKLKWMVPNFPLLGKMFRISLPGAFDIGTLMASQLLFLALINELGVASAAAHGLAVQIEACAFLPGAAFQIAAATMAGQFLGAKAPERATFSVWQCLACGGAIMVTAGLAMFFFGIEIATFFTGDRADPTTQNVASLLKIIAFALPSLAVVMIVSGGFRGAGDTAWPFYFTAIGFFVIRIPLAFYFCFESVTVPGIGWTFQGLDWGVQGAWYAMAIDLVLRSLMIAGRFFHGGWRQIKIDPVSH